MLIKPELFLKHVCLVRQWYIQLAIDAKLKSVLPLVPH